MHQYAYVNKLGINKVYPTSALPLKGMIPLFRVGLDHYAVTEVRPLL